MRPFLSVKSWLRRTQRFWNFLRCHRPIPQLGCRPELDPLENRELPGETFSSLALMPVEWMPFVSVADWEANEDLNDTEISENQNQTLWALPPENELNDILGNGGQMASESFSSQTASDMALSSIYSISLGINLDDLAANALSSNSNTTILSSATPATSAQTGTPQEGGGGAGPQSNANTPANTVSDPSTSPSNPAPPTAILNSPSTSQSSGTSPTSATAAASSHRKSRCRKLCNVYSSHDSIQHMRRSTRLTIISSSFGSDLAGATEGDWQRGTMQREASSYPVRYYDGMVVYSATDLSSGGFGTPWQYTRSWFNVSQFSGVHSYNGNGWINTSTPFLIKDPSGDINKPIYI